jgi:uncharacterized membrane protein
MRRHLTLVVMLAVVLLCVSTAGACPTCKAALEEGHNNVARGYFWSILFMMAMPFTLLASFSGYMYIEIRRAKRATDEVAAENGAS